MAPAPADGDAAQHFSAMYDECSHAYTNREDWDLTSTVLTLVDNFLGMHDLWRTQLGVRSNLRRDDESRRLGLEQVERLAAVAEWVGETLTASAMEGVLRTIRGESDRYAAHCKICRALEARQAY